MGIRAPSSIHENIESGGTAPKPLSDHPPSWKVVTGVQRATASEGAGVAQTSETGPGMSPSISESIDQTGWKDEVSSAAQPKPTPDPLAEAVATLSGLARDVVSYGAVVIPFAGVVDSRH